MDQQSPLIGVIVEGKSGKYRITDEINSGAQAMVYQGLDLAHNKDVAIKILLSTDFGATERAEREARILQKLRPHNIMYMRDSGTYNDNGVLKFFCVLPYFPGGTTLDDIIAEEGAIRPLDRAIDILCQVANGLKEAHQSGVVHRDIKPGNVMIHEGSGGHETAYVTDFGTAAVGNDLAEAFERKLTLDDRILGTPQYMSPQQLIGAGTDPEKEMRRRDPRNDVYSFGVTAYEILTGQTPFSSFEGNDLFDFAHKKRTGELLPDSLGKHHPELPAELVLLIDRCLLFHLENRPQIADVLSELNVIKLDQPAIMNSSPRRSRGRFKTPGQTRVSVDAETQVAARSDPPGARKTLDPPVPLPKVVMPPKRSLAGVWAVSLLMVLGVLGYLFVWPEIRQTLAAGDELVAKSAAVPSAPPIAPQILVTAVPSVSAPQPKPAASVKAKRPRPSGNYQWAPPSGTFDPSQPMPPGE